MAQHLSSINLSWNSIGKLSYSINWGYTDPTDINTLILAPSLPMFICHQLGTMKPSNGLILCNQIVDLFLEGRHIQYPINSALKGLSLEYVQGKNGVTLAVHPKASLFANSDSVEEGVRQCMNNYIHLIINSMDDRTKIVIKQLIGSALDCYLDFISTKLSDNQIGQDQDRWSLDFSREMTVMSQTIVSHYGSLPKDANIIELDAGVTRNYSALKNTLKSTCARLGMEE